jgi:hypothetical protein
MRRTICAFRYNIYPRHLERVGRLPKWDEEEEDGKKEMRTMKKFRKLVNLRAKRSDA